MLTCEKTWNAGRPPALLLESEDPRMRVRPQGWGPLLFSEGTGSPPERPQQADLPQEQTYPA